MIDRVLVIDDEYLIRELLKETLQRRGIEVITAESGEAAIEMLKQENFDLCFCDLRMKEVGGMDVLRFAREHVPQMLFVVMTAYGSIETAIEAMKLGAFDFIIKPFPPDQTEVIVEKARQWLQLVEERQYLRQEVIHKLKGEELLKEESFSPILPSKKRKSADQSSFENKTPIRILGESPAIQEIQWLIKRVAPTRATVLITGESGTGKELVAAEIHRLSDPTGEKPYIRMNCAAVPETLLESELFGHEKGAFTGAVERRIGRFELAHGGTLLLDEIAEITPAMQAKLLRVLQENEFERVGGTRTIQVDVRVIATTNRDLRKEVEKGNFREDLYYRLNVFPIRLPPLRDRGNDAWIIACYFLNYQSKVLGRPFRFTEDAKNCILRYPWPGNVRELENVIERIAILEDGPEISANAFPPEIKNYNLNQSIEKEMASFDLKGEKTLRIDEWERRLIIRALEETNGHREKAAALVGITSRTLRYKIQEYKRKGLWNDTFTWDD